MAEKMLEIEDGVGRHQELPIEARKLDHGLELFAVVCREILQERLALLHADRPEQFLPRGRGHMRNQFLGESQQPTRWLARQDGELFAHFLRRALDREDRNAAEVLELAQAVLPFGKAKRLTG